MNILYDENMPFAKEFFSSIGETTPFSGRDLTAEQVKNADVLLVRSITKVNENLLCQNTNLKFVGTATIGVDHIDQSYLNERNIPFYSSPGCNAISVAEYVISSLVVMAERYLLDLFSLTVGIIGAGNTGSRLSEKLNALGIKYYLHDPLLEENIESNGDEREFHSLEKVLACDVVSLHVPLTRSGEHHTYHLLNEQRLANLNKQQILINVCRGEVVDNHALLSLKKRQLGPKLVLDVWENEPNVLLPLVEFADIATAHIAGYSLEGKARGTEMLYVSLCKQLKIKPELSLSAFLPKSQIGLIEISTVLDQNLLNPLVKMVYDVRRDDAIFRQQLTVQGFDHIRKTYPARREFSAVKVTMPNTIDNHAVYQLGFQQ